MSFVHCDVADEDMFTGWLLDFTSSSHLSKILFGRYQHRGEKYSVKVLCTVLSIIFWFDVDYCFLIYNYLCNQCLSPLVLWVRISIRARCTTFCDKVCQWLVASRWFSPDSPVSSPNKTDSHDITEILLKVAFNTIKQTNKQTNPYYAWWWLCMYYLSFK